MSDVCGDVLMWHTIKLVIAFSIVTLAGAGWVMNIIELFCTGLTEHPIAVMVRIAGIIFPPLGCILGWL